MADSTLYYTLTDYRSQQLAKAVKAFWEASAEINKINNMIQLVEDNAVLGAAMGMAEADVATTKSIMINVVAALVNWNYAMSRLDKGL